MTRSDRLDVTKPSVGFARYAFALNNPVNYVDDGNEAYDFLSTSLEFLLARAAFGQMTGEPPVVIAAAGILNTSDGFPSFLNQFMANVNSFNPGGLTIVLSNGGSAVGQVARAAFGPTAHPQQEANLLTLTTALATQGTYFRIVGFSNGNAAIGAAAPQFSQSVLNYLTGISLVSLNTTLPSALGIFGLGKPTDVILSPFDPALRGARMFGDQLSPLGLMESLGLNRFPNVKVFLTNTGRTHDFAKNFAASGASLGGSFAPSVGPVFNFGQFGSFDRFGPGFESGSRFDFGMRGTFDTSLR